MTDREEVQAANARFYRALEEYDAGAMAGVWAHEPWVSCIHPGWEIIRGWPAVAASWEAIFAGESRLRITVDEVDVRVEGNCAWAICIEQIATRVGQSFHRSRAVATNVYVRRGDDWQLVLHHAVPLSQAAFPGASSTIQ